MGRGKQTDDNFTPILGARRGAEENEAPALAEETEDKIANHFAEIRESRQKRDNLASTSESPILLAQRVAQGIIEHEIPEKEFTVLSPDGTEHLYIVKTVYWNEGYLRKRKSLSSPIIIRNRNEEKSSNRTCSLLWEPRNPNSRWDLENPPTVNNWDYAGERLTNNPNIYGQLVLADAKTLAEWSEDAIPLLELIKANEQAKVDTLSQGISSADQALQNLRN
jgi:hypothetical protein